MVNFSIINEIIYFLMLIFCSESLFPIKDEKMDIETNMCFANLIASVLDKLMIESHYHSLCLLLVIYR